MKFLISTIPFLLLFLMFIQNALAKLGVRRVESTLHSMVVWTQSKRRRLPVIVWAPRPSSVVERSGDLFDFVD